MLEFGVFESSKCIFLLVGQMSKKVAPLKNAHLQVHMYVLGYYFSSCHDASF